MKTILNANCDSIAEFFNIDELLAFNISSNLNFGFFSHHFDNPQEKWKEAHPFKYPNGYIDYTVIDLLFVKKHFKLFSEKKFQTSSGWGKNLIDGKYEYEYKTYYIPY